MKAAFLYNPYHVLIISGLIATGVVFDRIIVPKKLEPLTKKILAGKTYELVLIRDSFVSEGIIRKILAIIKNLRLYKKLECGELFVANDQSILFLFAIKILDIGSVTLIDEGALEQLILRERASRISISYQLKKIFLGCRSRGSHKKISKLIVHEPAQPLWEEYRSTREIVDGAKLMNLAIENILKKIPALKSKKMLVIATSPITENGNGRYKNQEIDIITCLLNNNPKMHFVLKTHYREETEKYVGIVNEFQNLEFMECVLNELPIQIIFSQIEYLIGFHSSVITQFGNLFPCKALSLSRLVGSEHSQKFVMTSPKGVKFLQNSKL